MSQSIRKVGWFCLFMLFLPMSACISQPQSMAHSNSVLGRHMPNRTMTELLQSRGQSIPALAFQPGSQHLVLVARNSNADGEQWIERWDLTKKQIERTRQIEKERVVDLAYRADGRMVATANRIGEINLYDSETLAIESTLHLTQTPHTQPLRSIRFSPDGTRLAVLGEETIWLWEVATQRLTLTLPFTPTSVYRSAQLSFSSDGKLLATQDDNAITLWQISDGTAAFVIPFAAPGLCGVTFVPQQTQVASCRHNGAIELIDAKSNQVLQHFDNGPEATYSVAFSLDGQFLFTLGVHGHGGTGAGEEPIIALGIWSLDERSKVIQFDVLKGGYFNDATLSPDGEWLALFSDDSGDVQFLSLSDLTDFITVMTSLMPANPSPEEKAKVEGTK